MRSQYRGWVLVVLILTWLVPFAAHARLQTLVEGFHYVKKPCADNPDRTCARISNKRGVQVDTESFASVFQLTSFELRAQNRTKTIPVCRDPVRRKVWHMSHIKEVADRASDALWASCPQADRRVVLVPGETLDVGPTRGEFAFEDVEKAMQKAKDCGSDASCILEQLKGVFPPLKEISVSSIPVALPTSPESIPPASGVLNPPAPDNPQETLWQMTAIVLAALLLAAGSAIFVLIAFKRRLRERYEYECSIQSEAVLRVGHVNPFATEDDFVQLRTALNMIAGFSTQFADSALLPRIRQEITCLIEGIEEQVNKVESPEKRFSNLVAAVGALLDLVSRLQEEAEVARESCTSLEAAKSTDLQTNGPISSVSIPVGIPVIENVEAAASGSPERPRGSSPQASVALLRLVPVGLDPSDK